MYIPGRFGHKPDASQKHDWNKDLGDHNGLILPLSLQVYRSAVDKASSDNVSDNLPPLVEIDERATNGRRS